MRSAKPDLWMAETESPPPTMVVASWLEATAFGDGVGAVREGGELEDAHGAVPEDGAGVGDFGGEELCRFGADVEGHELGGEGFGALENRARGVRVEAVGEDVVDGQEKLDALGFCFVESGACDFDLVFFDERLAGLLALGAEEGVGHAAADEDGVGLVHEGVDDFDFVRDLGAADDGDEGLVGLVEGLAEMAELGLHEQAGGGLGDEVGDALGGGVGAVGAAEGVVDVDVAEGCELFGEGGVVGFFFGVEAEVFEQEGLALLQLVGELGGDFADAIGVRRLRFRLR